MKNLVCYDINGNKLIANYYIIEQLTDCGLKKLEFRLFLDGDNLDEWFDFKIVFLKNGFIKITDMFVGKNEHRQKGIPEALILEVKNLFNKKVISSSTKKPVLISEFRREEATKVWKRLIKKELANYDLENDYYFLL